MLAWRGAGHFGGPRDYSALAVRRGDFAGNVERAAEFENHRQLAKIGRPIERGEWGMTPSTVNAYYNPFMNDINFPAGVLLPPLHDPKLDASCKPGQPMVKEPEKICRIW